MPDCRAPTRPPRDRLVKISEVMDMTGLGRTMIYRLMRESDFPKQYKPGGYSSRWSENEVRKWIDAARRMPKAA